MKLNKNLIIGIIAFVAIFLIGFFIFRNNSEGTNIENEIVNVDNINQGSIGEETSWINFELKDVRTQQTFKISDFQNRPILLESFAVWCPVCAKQQDEIKKLHEELGDSFISISIDTDPNEDEARVRGHIESKGFDWYYAVSPSEMTQSLIKEFGPEIVSAPSAPVILICPDGNFRKLGSGVKKVEELKEEISKC